MLDKSGRSEAEKESEIATRANFHESAHVVVFTGMGILWIFPHLRIFLGSQCMTLNGHNQLKGDCMQSWP